MANELEGLATRVPHQHRVVGPPVADQNLAGAFTAFDAALVSPPAVTVYNRAVRRYEDTRHETLKRIPARLLGFDARPILVIGPPPGAGAHEAGP